MAVAATCYARGRLVRSKGDRGCLGVNSGDRNHALAWLPSGILETTIIRCGNNQALVRADSVRDAFNSPFRPFVLASTSIGQEGLDFHTWCHAVVHWNLPSNPVDLEQREGRVHRYKGHAVRKNIAERYGLAALSGIYAGGDPWQTLFQIASQRKSNGHSDLIPYWIFEDGSSRVERRIPLLPYSKEIGKLKLKRLKEGLALYRMVFWSTSPGRSNIQPQPEW